MSVEDGLIGCGSAAMLVGCWMITPALTLVAVGAGMVLVGFARLYKGR